MMRSLQGVTVIGGIGRASRGIAAWLVFIMVIISQTGLA